MVARWSFILPFCLWSLTARAADLLVAVGGSGNVYPTLTAAQAAAIENDRLLVQPGTYNEALVITKSLEIVSNSPNQRFTLNGNLSFSPTGSARTTTIIGMVLTGNITDNGPSAPAGSVLRLIDCHLNNVFSIAHAIRYVFMADSVFAGITFEKGDVFGCWVQAGTSGVALSQAGVQVVNEVNRVIGNEVIANPANPQTVLQFSARTPFRMENNLIKVGSAGGALSVGNASGAITTLPSSFINNSVIRTAGGAWGLVSVAETDPVPLDVRNNFSVAPTVPTISSSGTGLSQAFNTHSTNAGHVNSTSGAPTAGSPAINAGDPDVAYTDLDLSRNDAGCYGGSLSRDNFDDPVQPTAMIAFVNAPRRTQAALSFQITVEGFDR